ncbi:MAG: hypothetical protein JWR00_2696 [Rubritepida sp.]|nr:hypothetical protein [Rubritepida sp.]
MPSASGLVLHPRIAETYRGRVTSLRDALNDVWTRGGLMSALPLRTVACPPWNTRNTGTRAPTPPFIQLWNGGLKGDLLSASTCKVRNEFITNWHQ